MVPVCKDHADLKIARVIPRSKFDFPPAISPVVAVRKHLGREPLQTDVAKTDRRHRAAQKPRATGGNGQRLESFFILQASCVSHATRPPSSNFGATSYPCGIRNGKQIRRLR